MLQLVDSVESFDALLKDAGDKMICVDFSASWCGPCKVIGPKFETIAKEMEGKFIALKVDVDDVEELAARYKINAMPTFIIIKGGEKVDELIGASEAKLKELINKHV
ncbi:thioredoxin [Patella vulgata]|uniref:thioredoxin n=1 Tax=Patella vulgata TaxID=6465 RepID=UPI00217FB1CD|nr:thioredoxin [Patella vulgata]